MAKNTKDVKEELYELFNDATQKAKTAANADERESYLKQALETAEMISKFEALPPHKIKVPRPLPVPFVSSGW